MTKTNIIKVLFTVLLTVSNVCRAEEVNDSIQGSDDATFLYDWALAGSNGLIYVTNHKPDYDPPYNYGSAKHYDMYTPERFGVIDRTGKVLIDGENRWVKFDCDAHPDYCVFEEKDKGFGIIDAELNVVIPARYFEARTFDSFVAVKSSENSDWQIISLPRQKAVGIIPAVYNIKDVSEGMVLASTADEPFLFLDFKGKTIIPYSVLEKFISVCGFHDGLALVIDQDQKVGYIDNKGAIVILCTFEDPAEYTEKYSSFKNGVAFIATVNDDYGAIDKAGKQIIPFGKYNSLEHLPNGNIGAFDYDNEDVLRYTEFDYNLNVLNSYAIEGLEEAFIEETGTTVYKNEMTGEVEALENDQVGYVNGFRNGIAVSYLDDERRVCVINDRGEILIPNLALWGAEFYRDIILYVFDEEDSK
ncbi:MAG: WG repeat-containing protein [Muribaculaceae bacterium]|nr:WG repeat-containing protein [Muribaculaceae bacterium]